MKVEVIRSRRKTMSLQVRENGTVVARVPLYVREREIRQFVEGHLGWIENQQKKMEAEARVRHQIQPLSEKELAQLIKAARLDLTARAEYFAPLIGVEYGRISIRRQRTKWGSCSSKGNLNFNCLLMLAPEYVRDYVVVHELCHRRYMNHSLDFWNEVKCVLPDYSEGRKWLKTHGRELMMYQDAE